MSDDLVRRLRVDDPWCQPKCDEAADRIEELEGKMAKVLTIAHSAVESVYEVQTYEQPSDPWEENALLMCELDAFDFDVDSARTTLAEIKGETP